MQRCLLRAGAALALALVVAGCDSIRGPHVARLSPRVIGRVIDDQTGAPIRYVRLSLHGAEEKSRSSAPVKGVEGGPSADQIRTDRDGRFVVPSETAVSLLLATEPHGSVRVAFLHPDYEPLRTNFVAEAQAPGKSKSPPTIDAGDIRLRPLVREP